jgi:hypothetical protein
MEKLRRRGQETLAEQALAEQWEAARNKKVVERDVCVLYDCKTEDCFGWFRYCREIHPPYSTTGFLAIT